MSGTTNASLLVNVSESLPTRGGGGSALTSLTMNSVIAAWFFYAIIALVAVFGNLLVVTAFFINDKLRTVTNYFVLGLAVADILVGAISVPLWMYMLKIHASKTESKNFEDVGRFYKAMDGFAGISSILHLMAISMERYFCVGWAIKHRNTPKYVYYIALFMVWLISALAASVKLMIPTINGKGLALLTSVVFFLLPLTIIVIAYAAIWKVATTRMNNNPSKRSLKREIRTATTIAFVIGFFLVAWTPFFVTSVIVAYCLPPVCPYNWSATIFYKVLHYSNSSINPIVYGVRIPEFRKTFKFIFKRLFGPVLALCRRNAFLEDRNGNPNLRTETFNLGNENLLVGPVKNN